MPSFADSAFILVLALLLFGPKKLPELARYLGKLMGEFRRASAEFRLQMEDEFRVIEQAEQQKKIAAIEAAAPVAPLNIPEPEHPHLPPPPEVAASPENAPAEILSGNPTDARSAELASTNPKADDADPSGTTRLEPVAIASNGDLHMMPPSTGLPVGRGNGSSSLSAIFDAIPRAVEAPPTPVTVPAEPGATHDA